MNIKSPSTALLAAFAVFTSASSLNGAMVLLDNMNYGGGTIGSGVGDWVDGSNRLNYQGGINVNYTGGSYVNDPNNAGTGSLERNSNIDNRFFERDYSDAGLTGEFWVSMVINTTGVGGDNAGEIIGLSLNTTGGLSSSADILGVAFDGTDFRAGWRDHSAVSTSYNAGATLNLSNPLLLVARVNIGAGDDSFDMWVFDSGATFGTTQASLGAAHLSSSAADFGDQLDRIQVGGINGFQSNFDQIRISDLGGDNGLNEVLTLTAIPEPTSAVLGGLGAILLMMRRRRK